ncbi:MAG: hypothetical protein EOO88_23300 [Pedobacter sp.]|nr:MAG: hypothetical protein EOO88_23300 [Pedobacter sp.]
MTNNTGSYFNPILPKDPTLAKQVISSSERLEMIKHEKGFLSLFWGTAKNAPYNIAGLISILLSLTAVIYTFVHSYIPVEKSPISVKDYWLMVSPVITLSLGYLFGKTSTSTGATNEP